MFTGLIQAVGVIRSAQRTPAGLRLEVEAPEWDYRPRLGDSIAVSGCCLTLAEEFDGVMRFDVVRETLTKTTLGGLGIGASVNLERSLTVGDLIGGHFVQGHVDGVGSVERIQQGGDWRVWARPPEGLMRYMAPKGSIALDGVSLTLAGVGAGLIDVALIPTTLEKTTLRALKPGDRVNIETDPLAKTVVNYLEHFAPGTGER